MATTDDPASVTIREQIRDAILHGEYAPRQRLIEVDLCDRFGASRFLVRAALQDLAAQGLVEFQRNKGARVRSVSMDEAIQITEVRMLLEGFIAARAAQRVTPEQAAMLREIAMQMRAAVEAGELSRYSQLNASLHSSLRELAAHAIASKLLEELRALTVRHHFTLSLVPGRSAVSLPQHEAIVAAVVNGDAAAAEAAMHAHLQSVIDALRALG
ncbi:MAG TPA: GntR family transcriptional regulator [Solirubrobacteraceae bacterium]|nr:GntR family transcriptional regulator [Solirubrobacteraceae bacterium]